MPGYEYVALDARGLSQTGRIDAPSADAARSTLEASGWTVQELTAVAAPTVLSEQDFSRQSSLSLLTSLRALSEDVPQARVRSAIHDMADRIERGETVPFAFAAVQDRLPESMSALFSIGLDHGRLDELLTDYLDHTRRLADIRVALRMALAYPAFLLTSVVLLTFALAWFVMPIFENIYSDFGIELPFLTKSMLQFSILTRRYGLVLLLVFALLIVVIWQLMRLLIGPWVPQQLFRSIPYLGRVFYWSSLASSAETLAMLVDLQTPLPAAFRTAARSTDDHSLARGFQIAAEAVDGGAVAAEDLRGLPVELRGPFRWAQQPALLANALRNCSQIFVARSRVELQLTRWILEPFVLLIIAMGIGVGFVTLFVPLIRLLNDLS